MNHTDLMHKIAELKAENKLLLVSLRDQFAMASLTGLLSNPIVAFEARKDKKGIESYIKLSYSYADLTLAERAKGQTDD